MGPLLADELNIKEVVLVEDETEFSEVSYRPNFRSLGPRFGKRMKEVGAFIGSLDSTQIAALQSGGTLDVADGQISMEDIDVQRQEKEGVVVAIDNNLGVGLDVQLDEELISECTAREFVNRVQNMRKDAGLDVADRIRIGVVGQPGARRCGCASPRLYRGGDACVGDEYGISAYGSCFKTGVQVNNYAEISQLSAPIVECECFSLGKDTAGSVNAKMNKEDQAFFRKLIRKDGPDQRKRVCHRKDIAQRR